jgi:hypothetical protein
MFAHTTRSFLGGNHREVNKRQQKFDSRGTKSASDDRLEGWKARNRKLGEPEEVMMIKETWMQPYLAYMINKTLPEDIVEERRIIR